MNLNLKHGHLKNNSKRKKDSSFLSPPTAPINFTKNLHQTPTCKNTRSKQKLTKSKKWVPAKLRKIITERNQRK